MAEQSTFARRMMAQKLMTEKRDDPFSDSRFFAGKMRPSMDDIENPTRLSDMAGPAYGAAATGSLFAPGAGIADVMGYAPDPMQSGKMLPSFGENIGQGKYLDAGLQTLGVAGDVLQAGGAIVPPLLAVGTMLKAPRAARVADAAMDAAKAEDVLRTKYPDVELDVSETKKGLTLSKIVVPEGQRSKGVGSAVMSDLVSYADSKGLPLAVTPDSTFGGSKGRLEDFYKRFGFVRNKGRNKDFAFMETFVRQPKTDPNQATGAAMDAAQARYFETGKFEPPTAENPVSIVPPTETEPGIIAFHGSGADFDEFRLEMIGTGEGAQAYGYGLYFTDSEDIAKFYRDSLARGRSSIVYEGSAVKNARETDGLTDREMILDNIATEMAFFDQKPENVIKKKIKNLKQKIDDPVDISASAGDAEAQELADFIRQSAQRELEIYENLDPSKFTRGKMYKVGLAPKPDELLDYDLPLSQQPKKYKAALDEIAKIQGIPVVDQFGQSASFGSFQDALNQKVGPVNAMKEFTDAGIPGIKFFSGNTRNTAGGKLIDVAETTDGFRAKVAVDNRAGGLGGSGRVVTTSQPYETKQQALDWADEAIKNKESNYVIFDDKAVKILEKYGIVGPVAVTAAGTAAVNRGRNDNDNGGSILPDAGIM